MIGKTVEDFKIGTKVVISKHQERNSIETLHNPFGVVGMVFLTRPLGVLQVDVQWSNGGWNSYRPTELKILGELAHD